MNADDTTEEAVRHALLERFVADVAAGTPRELAEYQREHPGHEALVAAELAGLLDSAATLRQVGPYELLRELGRGGQAVVWLARDPRLHREVALKVLPRGIATRAEELRLQREATTAARLDDSGICPVYEVGRDGEHLYLAMKYIAGETLAQRLSRQRAGEDGGRPPLAATLAFFEQLASILHRAHEAGVVHRDLKPANVMIDERGQPVLLDFGLAASDDGSGSGLTRTGDLFGTPHYLPPERLDGRRHGGCVQGDVWALGVVLFEALTLRRPFDGATIEQLYGAILREEPEDLRKLRPDVPHDLRAVVGVCLEKDLARRYRTAADLAADLRAVRLGEAVGARPPGPWRRLVRWHRRHGVLATAGWLVLVGLVGTIHLQQRALQAVREAQDETAGLNDFLVQKLLLAVTPDQARGRTVTAAEVFDAAMRNVQTSFVGPSRTGATVAHVLGIANRALGRHAAARQCLESAVATRAALLGPNARETLESQFELARVYGQSDRVADGERLMAEVLAAQVREYGDGDPAALATRVEQAQLAMEAGHYAEAERIAGAAVAASRAAFGARDRRTLNARSVHGRALDRCGRREEAEVALRDVLDGRRDVLGPDAPGVLDAFNDLASLLHDEALWDGLAAKWDEAAACYEQAVELVGRLDGTHSHRRATAINNLASFLQDRARLGDDRAMLDRAITLFRESLALREEIDGPDSSRAATACSNLGGALLEARDLAAAVALLERAAGIRDRVLGPLHPEAVRGAFNLAMAQSLSAGPRGALPLLAGVEERLQKCVDVDRRTRLAYRRGLLTVRQRAGENEEVLRQGPGLFAECRELWPDGGPEGRGVADVLAHAAEATGDAEGAAKWRRLASPPVPK